jgi:hypothetical protein
MRPRPYLRAYMAGIVVPTLFLLVIIALDAVHRFYFEVSTQFVLGIAAPPLERALLFPMAVVPNVWGVWNILYLALRSRVRWPLGAHGAMLVPILMPAGIALARTLDVFTIQWHLALPMLPLGMAIYYLVWKHVVGRLNEEMGIAD